MQQLTDLMQLILTQGVHRPDRTGTGTRSVFGQQMRFDLNQGFPAVTTKKLAWRAMLSELLWFIEGSGDERRLREILHGDRNSEKSTIWTENAQAPYWVSRSAFPGDLGRVYGVQWRKWQVNKPDGTIQYVDQLTQLIDGIRKDPCGRRHILSAWNPGELDQMALPPCHMMAQFYVADGKLSCQMYQRSADCFLGVPLNIASYSLLTHMIAQVCDLSVGEFVHVIGDAHIYDNHVQQTIEQISRKPFDLPQLKMNPDIRDITKFTMSDFELVGYVSHATIKAPMAV